MNRSAATPPPAAVLWDMDGTIVDTEPYWFESEYELVESHGGAWSDEKAHSLVGLDLRDSAAIVRDRGGVDLPIDDIVNRLLDGVIRRVREHVPWRPGARELLADLADAGVPTALVTMSWQRFADAVVDALPPDSFTAVITGDQVSHGKPHPEPYLAAASALGVDPRRCIAIEDSPNGLRSAVAAGCRTIAVPNVVDIPDADEYLVVQSLTELSLASLGFDIDSKHALDGDDAGGDDGDATADLDADFDLPAHQRPSRRSGWVWIAALVGLMIGAGGAAIALRPVTAVKPLADIPMAGWAPYWVMPGATATVATEGTLLQELSPFWYHVTGDGTIEAAGNTPPAQLSGLLAAAKATRLTVLPSVADETASGTMAALLADPTKRAAHVAALVALVTSKGYDGIDLDYERFAFADPASSWATTRPHWVAFVDELAAALHARHKLLSVSVPPIYDTGRTSSSGNWVYDYAAMGKVADRVRIMAYDYSVSEPGPIGPLDWTRTAVRAAKRAIADDGRIVLGVPLYGRNWVTGTTGSCPAAAQGRVAVPLNEAADLAAKRHATPVYDPVTGETSFEYSLTVASGAKSCTQERLVRYVDAQGARARVDLARAERIGGVSFWALGFDDSSVWAAVAAVSRPQASPSTTAP